MICNVSYLAPMIPFCLTSASIAKNSGEGSRPSFHKSGMLVLWQKNILQYENQAG